MNCNYDKWHAINGIPVRDVMNNDDAFTPRTALYNYQCVCDLGLVAMQGE